MKTDVLCVDLGDNHVAIVVVPEDQSSEVLCDAVATRAHCCRFCSSGLARASRTATAACKGIEGWGARSASMQLGRCTQLTRIFNECV